jgi:hypothetical protein
VKSTTPPHRRQQARQPTQEQAAALLGAHGTLTANAHVITASKTRYGTRSFGKRGYAQAAILVLYPAALPEHVNKLQLTDKVNKVLAGNPKYRATGYGELGRMTVIRALNELHAANADPRKITI